MARDVGVMVRTAEEIDAVATGNPFAEQPGNRVVAIFLDEAPPADALDAAKACRRRADGAWDARNLCALPERPGPVEAGDSGGGQGTARNMNTVARLAELAREQS